MISQSLNITVRGDRSYHQKSNRRVDSAVSINFQISLWRDYAKTDGQVSLAVAGFNIWRVPGTCWEAKRHVRDFGGRTGYSCGEQESGKAVERVSRSICRNCRVLGSRSL